MKKWSENEELLISQLREGDKWEKWLAMLIIKAGHPAHTQPLRVRQHISQADEFGDQVDIEVYGRIIEVKSRDLYFTHDPSSFPYRTAFVDTVSGWNRKTRKPDAYVCVSQKNKGIICLPGRTREHWKIKEDVWDHKRKIYDDFYVCDIRHWKPGNSLARTLAKVRGRVLD